MFHVDHVMLVKRCESAIFPQTRSIDQQQQLAALALQTPCCTRLRTHQFRRTSAMTPARATLLCALLLLLLVPVSVSSTLSTSAADLLSGVAAVRKCPQIRAPLHNIEHELVHIHSFVNVDAQARTLCVQRGIPDHRCAPVVRALLDAAQEMAMLDVTEGLVNVTLDYSLEFSLTQPQSPAERQKRATSDATTAAPGGNNANESVVGTLIVLPEDPLEDTVARLCHQNNADSHGCATMFAAIEALVVSYWGCANDTAAEIPVLASPQALASHEVSNTQAQQEAMRVQIALALTTSDNVDRHIDVTLDAASDLDLQVALVCREHALPLESCETLLRRAHNATKTAPAFQRQHHHQLNVTSPGRRRMYIPSRRLVLKLGPPFLNASGDPLVCVYVDNDDAPVMCSPKIWDDPKFFEKHSLALGHHMLTFAIVPSRSGIKDSGSDGDSTALSQAPRPLASSIKRSEWTAAVHFDIVEPRIELKGLAIKTEVQSASTRAAYIAATLETAHFDLDDPHHRLCVLHNDIFECFQPAAVTIVYDAREDATLARKMVLRVPLFNASTGVHEVTFLLVNEYHVALAVTPPLGITLSLDDDVVPLVHTNTSTFVDLRTRVTQCPRVCPDALAASLRLRWICDLWRHEWAFYSQNGEDGVLQSIFANIGARHREYVEFGTEDGRECNTRYLREAYNWTGLLMDGGHANAAINLHREFITAENVNALFGKHGVSRHFDLLSVDVDFNDYWILDALDLAQFAPRVIVCEYNSHVPATEARAVQYNATRGWDSRTDYFGVSMRALEVWGTRHNYSLVYCESHGVNCFLVHNDALGANVSALLPSADVFVPPNFFGNGWSYPNESRAGDNWVWLA